MDRGRTCTRSLEPVDQRRTRWIRGAFVIAQIPSLIGIIRISGPF